MSYLFAEFFFSLFGRIVLFIMYRNVDKMRKVRDAEYAGYYSGAGRVYLLNAVAFIGAASLTIFLIVYIVKLILGVISG